MSTYARIPGESTITAQPGSGSLADNQREQEAADARGTLPHIRIEPRPTIVSLHLDEIWGRRDLLYNYVLRTFRARYKQTVLGQFWVILEPLLLALVFAVVFGLWGRIDTGEIPHVLYYFSGLIIWFCFANSLKYNVNVLVSNSNLVKKVYFPRLMLPIAEIMCAGIDFTFGFLVLLATSLIYSAYPSWTIILVPFFVFWMLMFGLGLGLWLSALQVEYRDIGRSLSSVLRFWLFMSPIVYPPSIVPQEYQAIYFMNPVASLVCGLRWALWGIQPAPSYPLLYSIVVACLLLISGAYFFKHREAVFADMI